MIAAEFVKGEDGCVNIKGETYSLNEHINNAIKENKRHLGQFEAPILQVCLLMPL